MTLTNTNLLFSNTLQQIRAAQTPLDMSRVLVQALESFATETSSVFTFLWDAQMPFYRDLSFVSGILSTDYEAIMSEIRQANALHDKLLQKLITHYFSGQEVRYQFLNITQENLGVFIQIGEISPEWKTWIQDLMTIIELKLETFILQNELHNKPNSLKAQKAHYQIVAEHAGDMILIFDDEFHINYVSQSVKSLLGYSASYMRRMQLTRLVFAADQKKLSLDLQGKKVQKQHNFYHTVRLLNREGKFVRFEIHIRQFKSQQSDYQYIAICKSVQEQYEAIEKLEKTQANYRLLAEHAKDLICVHNPEGEFVYISPSVRELLGYEPDELIGKSHHILFHHEDVIGLKAGYKKVKKHKAKHLSRYRFKHKSGEYLWFETLTTSVENLAGETQNLITSSRDISARIEHEVKLKENLNFMNKLLEAIPIPVFYKNISGTYLNCNRRFAQTLGKRKTEIIGKKAHEIFDPSQALQYEKSDQVIIQSGMYQRFEMKIILSENDTHNMLIYKDLYRNNLNEPQGIIGAMLDITDQKQNEMKLEKINRHLILTEEELRQNSEELNASNEHLTHIKIELEQALKREKETQAQLVHQGKMASIGLLTAGIAHEINNPLTFITGGIEALELHLQEIIPILTEYDKLLPDDELHTLQEKIKKINLWKEEEEYEETLNYLQTTMVSIKEGVQRATEIVRGLKTFSGGKHEVFRPADLHEGLDSTLVILRNELKGRITVIREYEPNLPFVECHIGQINQVFMNLLANATEAIEGDGTITVRTNSEKNYVRIRIADTGEGMSSETQEKLFEPFYSTKGTKGTGLGLAISYGIIEKHKGAIRLVSQMGKGTEFTLFLPISPQYELPENL